MVIIPDIFESEASVYPVLESVVELVELVLLEIVGTFVTRFRRLALADFPDNLSPLVDLVERLTTLLTVLSRCLLLL